MGADPEVIREMAKYMAMRSNTMTFESIQDKLNQLRDVGIPEMDLQVRIMAAQENLNHFAPVSIPLALGRMKINTTDIEKAKESFKKLAESINEFQKQTILRDNTPTSKFFTKSKQNYKR